MTKPGSSSKVKVAVRVRPFNKRELGLNTECVVDMLKDQTLLSQPGKSTTTMLYANITSQTFAFDHCFWSMDSEQKEKFSNQELVFDSLGVELLDNAFAGYNACIFAYGQTGSGKSYTMMGSHEQPGLIPRLCDALFDRIHEETRDNQSFKVEVSYMEIYNEKVRDLLDPNGGKQQHLKVREHKLLGPYVDGLQQLVSSSAQDVQELMSEGSKSRTVAATKMNAESSRSHAVFTLIVTHTMVDVQSGVSGERVSKLSLVDLAGSERSSKTGASGARLKEGSNINKWGLNECCYVTMPDKVSGSHVVLCNFEQFIGGLVGLYRSLTTLGLVISSLADQSAGKAKNKFVPYRDSTLTWILKDNLGGNSRTTMVATLSPSADNYEETLSTLRYADRAKRIVNKAVVNEDPNARIIRELREEVEKLQGQLKQSESMRAPDLKEKLEESEKLIKEISLTWEERLRKTEQVHKQRQETLEKMGISLETSGIKVEKTKCFLVNLNADPSLNELLVYYLKVANNILCKDDSFDTFENEKYVTKYSNPHTIVGQSDSSDIQLSGLGISQQHAELFVQEEDGVSTVAIEPLDGARTCVNGRVMSSRCNLRHGDRILWGNNHFFRINVPRLKSKIPELAPIEPQYVISMFFLYYTISIAPIQETIMSLEREFQLLQDESNGSPSVERLDERERKKYELVGGMCMLGVHKTLGIPQLVTKDTGTGNWKGRWKKDLKQYRKKKTEFRRSICQLREELVRAQTLTREANDLAEEMKRDTEFTVTMRIPTHNLTPNRKQGTLLCEPAVQVIRQGKDCQVWSVEKLSNRIVDMREMYQAHQVDGNAQVVRSANRCNKNGYIFFDCLPQDSLRFNIINKYDDPFNETDRSQLLVGVANVFLTCLLQGNSLRYPVPIINQHGQVAGKLLVDVQRLVCYAINSHQMQYTFVSFTSHSQPKLLYHRVTIMEANGLSTSLSPFVECQYSFLDCPEVTLVPPDLSPDKVSPKRRLVWFNHTMEFTCNVTEELVDKLTSSASLAVEVWGHRDRYHSNLARTPSSPRAWGSVGRVRGARNRGWSEVLKRLRVDVSIQELADTGEYVAVDILPKPEVPCVGTFQLKQGQSRRIHACVTPVEESGTLPLICDSVAAIYAGSITCRAANRDRGLDSYQDRDLSDLKNEWLKALERRKQHLDKQIKNLTSKENKTELERERESNLFDQWVTLTEERNAMLAPTHSSGVPGAPASWVPPPSVEMHIPIIFLDLDSDPVECEDLIRAPAGLDSELPQEIPGTFVQLPFVRAPQTDVISATASWDSSMHDSLFLNRVTPSGERVYIIVKVHLRLSHPVEMDLVLRKRLCVAIYRQKGFTASIMRKMQGRALPTSGVIYEIASSIPPPTSEGEDHDTMAVLAA
uniref:Kinesin motor domain-containing protein n=1 Tax=Ciona savignyi TaxID=51511 RepID=H2ZK90_CIOSA